MQNVLFEESIDGLYISRVVRDFKFTMSDVHIHYNDYEVYYLLWAVHQPGRTGL